MSKHNLNLKQDDFSITKSKEKAVAVNAVQDVQDVAGYGHTQGNRSGSKMKRINILLTQENHDFLKDKATKNHVTLSKYFNYLLLKSIDEQDVQDVDNSYKIMSKYKYRINMAFSDINYLYVKNTSFDLKVSPSSLINQIIDLYRMETIA